MKAPIAAPMTCAVYSPAIGNRSLPCSLAGMSRVAQDLVQRLLDEFGLALFDHQHRLLGPAELDHLAVDDRVGHVHHIERHARLAPDIGKAGLAQRA